MPVLEVRESGQCSSASRLPLRRLAVLYIRFSSARVHTAPLRILCAKLAWFRNRAAPMAFGLVFLGHEGEVWTVDVRLSGSGRAPGSMVFSRPTFINPSEEREFAAVPTCWPDCTSDQLRGFLETAHGTSS